VRRRRERSQKKLNKMDKEHEALVGWYNDVQNKRFPDNIEDQPTASSFYYFERLCKTLPNPTLENVLKAYDPAKYNKN
jgi:hypothetical protein